MIYITGDTHGDQLRFIEGNMPSESEWTSEDFLIICGDFGFVFSDSKIENQFLDYLENKPYTICFCDGNHENFPRIYRYPEQSWHGGRIHRIRDNIIHLMRGYVFTIDGKTIFTMGGAYSIDKYMRKEGYSWWKEELPLRILKSTISKLITLSRIQLREKLFGECVNIRMNMIWSLPGS